MPDTTPKPFVFVLMPFEQPFNDVYQLGIKPAAEEAGAYCERIDEQIFAESILARIYNQIAKADLIVADMTRRNPNVFYEVGYAHALGRTVILLTQNSDDIPFDLKHYPHIIYGTSIAGMKEQLRKRIAYHLSNPIDKMKPDRCGPVFAISGTVVEPGVCVDIPLEREQSNEQQIVVGINNPEDTVADWSDAGLALILPENFPAGYGYGVQLPDKRFLHDLRGIGRLLPGAWEIKQAEIPRGLAISSMRQMIPAELRVFSPTGPQSKAFFITFVSPNK